MALCVTLLIHEANICMNEQIKGGQGSQHLLWVSEMAWAGISHVHGFLSHVQYRNVLVESTVKHVGPNSIGVQLD